MMSLPPLFQQDDEGRWWPDPFTQGPYQGLQGGGVAGLLCAAIEQQAGGEGWGEIASVATYFLRPTPLDAIELDVKPIRVGRRVSIVDATLRNRDVIVATQRATLITPEHDPSLPTPNTSDLVDPTAFAPLPKHRVRKAEWMWLAQEIRKEAKDRIWFRPTRKLVAHPVAFAHVLPAADWAHGLGPPTPLRVRPERATPNPDVVVHFARPPQGEWIGVNWHLTWTQQSVGLGEAKLMDTSGIFGCVSMSVAIL
ncbi:MAG: thioesterase family protein [Phenylobacterium sp.]|nr:thioesterase family protein [Methylobacterium sp.]MCA6251822.1 thioesterase family protein [Phenylobacterium sp.]MCA6259013.1 thioesterase family protein [Phenylobacterium sp.]MCA6301189.1 thioesterase family protein [Phenylobacterium sp.]